MQVLILAVTKRKGGFCIAGIAENKWIQLKGRIY